MMKWDEIVGEDAMLAPKEQTPAKKEVIDLHINKSSQAYKDAISAYRNGKRVNVTDMTDEQYKEFLKSAC